MITNLLIVDDFYRDPDAVRKFALSQTFDVRGNFPGLRSQPFLTGIYAPNGRPVVEHLGEYPQGQRAARGEPGWERFKNLPHGKYCSKTGRALR